MPASPTPTLAQVSRLIAAAEKVCDVGDAKFALGEAKASEESAKYSGFVDSRKSAADDRDLYLRLAASSAMAAVVRFYWEVLMGAGHTPDTKFQAAAEDMHRRLSVAMMTNNIDAMCAALEGVK